jgi:AcrR family transcriptional regulator
MRPPEQDKRRELARRAVEVLQREGLDVPISRLAVALDVKRPTLLYHFPTRSHIVETALEDLLTEQAEFVLARIAEHTHPMAQLDAQVRAVHAFHHGREARFLFLTQAIAASSRERMAELIDVGNRVFEAHRCAMAARIERGIAEGSIAPCDPSALIALVRAVSDGLLVQRVMTGLELAPVHELLWAHVLRPLVIDEPQETTCSASTSAVAAAHSASATAASSTKRTRTRRA